MPVNTSLRPALACALLLAIATPLVATAQRVLLPGKDTKRVLVMAFRGDATAGPKAADEIRDRIADEFNIRQLMPINKKDIDTNLESSGFKPDSALASTDNAALGKVLRADEVIDGTVTRTPAGYRIAARMFLPRDATLAQPLVTIESGNFGDAAKAVVREYDVARKQMEGNQDCENGIRAGTLPAAIAGARKGIAAYPKATVARLCLASAYQAYKNTADSTGTWADSVIAITGQVIALDPASKIAYQLRVDAFKQRKDTAKLVDALIGYMNSDPANSSLREQVIAELILMDMAHKAVPLAKQQMADNQGVPDVARMYWSVLRAARMWKDAVAAGKAVVAIDPASADTNYYYRQLADLTQDSAFAAAAAMAAEAAGKFPRNVSFLMQKAQNERRIGRLEDARRSLEAALVVDPTVNGANYILAQIAGDLRNGDDAIRYAKADAADPANKARAAALLLAIGKAEYDSANAAKKPEEFRKAIPILETSSELNATPTASFLIAAAAYQVMSGMGDLLRTSRSCDDFKSANDLLSLVNIHMPRGGSVSPETAKIILGGAGQFEAFIAGRMRSLCRA